MSTTFRRYAPDQTLLLPADMREWLPGGSGCRKATWRIT